MANLYLEAANRFLSKSRFGEALPNLIQACEEEPGCEAALKHIYENYVKPYEDSFRKNFLLNCGDLHIQSYEDCQIDFIPICDTCGVSRYVLYDKVCKQFEGELDINVWREPVAAPESPFGLLIADCWDIRELLPVLREKQWSDIYFVLNSCRQKLMSFFKLADLHQILPGNFHFFATTEEMQAFFLKNNNVYLPRKVMAPASKRYEEILEEIHKMRIQSGVPSDRVLLSVCIPSFNRGERALEAVEYALSSEFDIEIEIIVSNNGSTMGKQSYEKIRNISDSRVRYYEFAENKGVAANVHNCLEKSHGRFSILFSDEDTLAIEHLSEAFTYLHSLRGISTCVFNASKRYKDNEFTAAYPAEVFKAKKNAVLRSFRMNYITGVCFNMDYLRQLPAFKSTSSLQENEYYMIYPHCYFAALMAEKYDVANAGLVLWNCGEQEKSGGMNVKDYCSTIYQRLGQEAGLVHAARQVLSEHDCQEVFLQRIGSTFAMLAGGYNLYGTVTSSTYSWVDVCSMHYKNCMEILKMSDFGNGEGLVEAIDRIFLDWLDCRRIRKWFSPQENLKSTLRAEAARYCYNQGTSFMEIDFEKIDEGLDCFLNKLPQ